MLYNEKKNKTGMSFIVLNWLIIFKHDNCGRIIMMQNKETLKYVYDYETLDADMKRWEKAEDKLK